MRKLRILALLFLSLFLFACASTDDKVSEVTPEVPEVTEQINNEETDNEISETENTENLDETTSEENALEAIPEETPVIEHEELEEIEEPEVQDLPPEEPVVTEEDVIEVSEPEVELPVEQISEDEIEVLPAIEEVAVTEAENDTTINFDEIPTEGTGNAELSSDIIRWTEDDNDKTEDEESSPEMTETEETADDSEEETEIESEENEEPEEEIIIVPSRTVTMNKGETLVVIYPGNGWIYMGSLSEYNNLASKGRKLGATDTKYTLLAKDSGTQIHHFYKEDNLTGEYIDDYLEVVVTTKKSNSKVTVTAPAYAEIVPEKPAKSEAKKYYESLETSEKKPAAKPKTSTEKVENKPETEKSVPVTDTITEQSAKTEKSSKTEPKKESAAEKTKTEESTSFYIQPAENELEQMDEVLEVNNNNDDDIMFIDDEIDVDTDALLNEATIAYENKDYSKAIDQLNQFFEHAESRRDEALFLKGQILEQDSYLKDIKGAVNAYQSLLDNYPASSYWNKANKRIIYLKRFYIEVR